MEIGKIDFSEMDYRSPVELIVEDLQTKVEDHIVSAVQKMGVNVDKDELLRALRYDREQYDKGYISGYTRRGMEIIRCKDCKHYDAEQCYCHVWGDRFAHWEEYEPVDPYGFCDCGEVRDV